MESISLLFLVAFFLGALVSLFWGVYIIRLDLKSTINRTFFLMCIALSIWSFGFTMANAASTLASALFWRRVSAVGWTSIFSIILHFLILITNIKGVGKVNKYLFLIHIPAVITMYIFAFSNKMVVIQYNLVQIDYGWTNVAVNNGWDYFYYAYYTLYMLVSLMIVWLWKGQIKDRMRLRQAKLIFVAILAAALLGSLTDLVANTFLAKPLPQMAPLFILLPTWAMYYSARHYGVLDIGRAYETDLVVTEQDKRVIFNNLAIAFYVAAVLGFAAEYLPYMNERDSLKSALLKALTLFGIGVAIRIIQLIKKESIRENLIIVVLVSSIPMALLQYLKYGGVTVWAFPLVIIISSIVFSKLTLLISTTVAAIITQILIGLLRPEITVVVDRYDYLLRIGMLSVAFFIGLYINKIYVAKIKENDQQIAFQKMISTVLFDFIGFNQQEADEKINHLLESIVSFFNADRAYLFTINHKDNTMTYSNEWCKAGINKEVGTIEAMSLDEFPWWIAELNKKGIVCIEDVKTMPVEASEEQEELSRQSVKSLVSVPVMGDGKMHAFIGVDSVLTRKKWSDDNIELLKIIANILSTTLTPILTDEVTRFMAYNDSLTKLPNRFLFEDKVNQAIHLAKRTEKFIAIMFIDLDGFKAVNDAIGHRGGDILLKQVAQGLLSVVRKSDAVARFGGDEFMVMINNIENYYTISRIADKIMSIFSSPFTVNKQDFLITASAGIAVYPEDGEDSDDLVRNADIAMYKAKSEGKNQYALCTKEIKDDIKRDMALSNDLYRALERDELLVYYQPQVDLATDRIVGVEALVRWMHPTKGMISPGIFIPLAEKNSLITSIGEWVLRTACTQNKEWQDMGLPHIDMAVNLSAIQIINFRIADNIERIIKETGLDPKYIELEITESTAIKGTHLVLDVLNKLKRIGLSIAIDDFGTEYSSLNRLKQLPIDRIKIDMQFVQGIETNEKDKAITMVIINLAKSLGLSVLAEGVETDVQLEFLKQKKCDCVQGYYYYKPMPGDEMENILRNLL